jgi:predicted MFS family arabinose efflux permease
MEERHWAAVVVTAVAIFVLVTSEMLPVSLLSALSRDLSVSVGVAGTTLTAPGLVAALAAPTLPIAAWRVDRRSLLGVLLGVLALSNALCALAPSFPVLFAARVLAGVSIGGSWAMAAGIGGRLVTGRSSARATSIIFGGVSVATIVGVPASALIGDAWGWRAAFGVSALSAALIGLVLVRVLPALPGSRASSPAALAESARNPAVRAGLVITALVVVGHFAAYTFVSPVLQASAGIAEGQLGTLLLVYGVTGVGGNFLAGALTARDVRRVMQGVALLLALAMFTLPAVATTPRGAALVMAWWGVSYGAVGVTVQAWIHQASPRAVEPATALSASVFNLAIAAGAFVGGRVVDQLGPLHVTTVGGVLALLAFVAAQLTRPDAPDCTAPLGREPEHGSCGT